MTLATPCCHTPWSTHHHSTITLQPRIASRPSSSLGREMKGKADTTPCSTGTRLT